MACLPPNCIPTPNPLKCYPDDYHQHLIVSSTDHVPSFPEFCENWLKGLCVILLTGKNSNENTTSVAEVTISKTQHNQRIVRL